MIPQTEISSGKALHCNFGEQVLEHNEGQEEADITGSVPDLGEAGSWYYVVDCGTCKAVIPFKHAPEGEPILRLPTMRVRCFQCRTVHAYATDLISHRKAVAPRETLEKDESANAPGSEPPRKQPDARNVEDPVGLVETKIDPDTSLLQQDNGVIEAALGGNSVIVPASGKRVMIFFSSSCLFSIGLSLQLALSLFGPVPRAGSNEAHSYVLAALLNSAYFGVILCGLALFIFGAGTFLIERYGFRFNVFGKTILVFVTSNAFVRSFMTLINSSAKTVSVASLVRRARNALLPMVSGATTVRSRIKRSAKLRLRHYQ
jgi:hypothetical protein